MKDTYTTAGYRRSLLIAFLPLLAASLAFLPGCGETVAVTDSIEVKGSSTEARMVRMLAREYRKKNPGMPINVRGGGSGDGIKSLIDGDINIANSSRAMKDGEIKRAKSKDVDPVGIVFALDGLAVIVNDSLGIDALSLEQIGQIYRGDVKNWKEVGGPDWPIKTFGRQSSSGTFSYFRDRVVQGDYSQDLHRMISSSQVVQVVQSVPESIGYVGIGNALSGGDQKVAEGLKVLSIVSESGEIVSPLDYENIVSGKYPLTRPLYQYTDGKPVGPIRDFISYILSEEGQSIVKQFGFYRITPTYVQQNELYLSSGK